MDSGSIRYSQACAAAERGRGGATPLALPSDGLPRPEAFSQLVHIKGVRAQLELYPRPEFNAALESAALGGLECYRFSRRAFTSMDHVPIALVPRSSHVVLAHLPAVISQAADTVLALGHRLYFEVEGVLLGIDDDNDTDDADDGPGVCLPLRGGGSSTCGASTSILSSSGKTILTSSGSIQRPLTPTSFQRTRSGSLSGGLRCSINNSLGAGPNSLSGGSNNPAGAAAGGGGAKVAAWMPSGSSDAAPSVPIRRYSGGTASPGSGSGSSCAAAGSASQQSPLQSFSSFKLSASSSFRSLRAALSGRYSVSNRTAPRYSEPDLDLPADQRVNEFEDDTMQQQGVMLMNGGRYSYDRLAVVIIVFADDEEGVRAFKQELWQRGVRPWGGGASEQQQQLQQLFQQLNRTVKLCK